MSPPSPASEPGRILIVDNDADVAGAVRRLLVLRGFEVDAAPDGETALQLVGERRAAGRDVELVLLDLRMPGLSGLEVLNGLDRLETPPFVIVLSGYVGEEDRERLSRSPQVRTIVRKPFDIAELGATAQAVIAARRSGPAPSGADPSSALPFDAARLS